MRQGAPSRTEGYFHGGSVVSGLRGTATLAPGAVDVRCRGVPRCIQGCVQGCIRVCLRCFTAVYCRYLRFYSVLHRFLTVLTLFYAVFDTVLRRFEEKSENGA